MHTDVQQIINANERFTRTFNTVLSLLLVIEVYKWKFPYQMSECILKIWIWFGNLLKLNLAKVIWICWIGKWRKIHQVLKRCIVSWLSFKMKMMH
jgi:hypothetical protein